MARQIQAPEDQVRILFTVDEAARFLRGWEPIPNAGGDDPLNRAIQRCYDELNDAFPDAGEYVETYVEPAPWAGDDRRWRAVNFRFAQDAVERAGHDADALADWLAAETPDLLFAIEESP